VIEARAFFSDALRESQKAPLIPDGYFSVVYNCSLNECADELQRIESVRETYRVCKRGGVARFVVDLVDDSNANLLLKEIGFQQFLSETGFYGISIIERTDTPVRVAEGVEFYRYVIDGYRGKDGPCLDCGQAVIYKGPWRKVFDDDGHVFERDVRTAVCEKTFKIMSHVPYGNDVILVEPYVPVNIADAPVFSCTSKARSPAETKGLVPNCSEGESGSCC
jgi:hypothetical protein